MQEKIINTPFHEKGHIIGEELQNDVSNFLLFNFVGGIHECPAGDS